MTLQSIDIPESIRKIPVSTRVGSLIDDANDRIEAFMLADESVIEDFVTCDFQLLDQSLDWIQQNQLLKGSRFCELGSGFGVAAMLAAIRGMEAVGIEIEPALVEQSIQLARDLDVTAKFFCGSFVPRDVVGTFAVGRELVEGEKSDAYQQIGLAMEEFDLFFAFPWPREHAALESLFDNCAANGAMLLTYRERAGMHLLRKN